MRDISPLPQAIPLPRQPETRLDARYLIPCTILLGAALPAASATPAAQYVELCATCHLPGIHGAPKVGDRDDWSRRLRAGLNTVYRNAIEGIDNTAMLAKGGHSGQSDAAIRAIVDYMIAASAVPESALREAARYDRLNISDRDFIRRDADYDGFLSRGELDGDALLLARYAQADADRDGRLAPAEYRAAETAIARELAAVPVDDAALGAAVRKALTAVNGVDLQYVKIAVRAGAVTLTGIVGHADIAIRAGDALKRIAGVRKIDNRLVSGDQIGWD